MRTERKTPCRSSSHPQSYAKRVAATFIQSCNFFPQTAAVPNFKDGCEAGITSVIDCSFRVIPPFRELLLGRCILHLMSRRLAFLFLIVALAMSPCAFAHPGRGWYGSPADGCDCEIGTDVTDRPRNRLPTTQVRCRAIREPDRIRLQPSPSRSSSRLRPPKRRVGRGTTRYCGGRTLFL